MDGKLLFSISDGSLEDKKLQVKDIEFKGDNHYTWSGLTTNQLFSATFIKDENGFAGKLTNFGSGDIYNIFPLSNNVSVLIKLKESFNPNSCGTFSSALFQPETPFAPVNNDCNEGVSNEHIDILFLLTPDAQDYIVNQNFNNTFLNLLIAELNLSFANSGIGHSVDYTWSDFNWDWIPSEDPTLDKCGAEIEDLKIDEQANLLRDETKADIVILLSRENIWSSSGGVEACAPELSPTLQSENGFIIFKIEKILSRLHFSHEIGHVFGTLHNHLNCFPSDPEYLKSDCSHAHKLQGHPKQLTTIMWPGTGNLQHFSDPEISFESVPTGKYGDPSCQKPDHNNAGRIRTSGSFVSNYRESLGVNGNINLKYDNCMLNLEANVQPSNTGYEYTWSWSYDGIFTNQYPGTVLGNGALLIVDEPEDNICSSYFIQLAISLNGVIVESEVLFQVGGICSDNVQGCGGQTQNLTGSNDFSITSSEPISNDIEDKYIGSSVIYEKYAVDLLGRVIKIFNGNISDNIIQEYVSNDYQGVYFIVFLDSNKLPVVSKHISL